MVLNILYPYTFKEDHKLTDQVFYHSVWCFALICQICHTQTHKGDRMVKRVFFQPCFNFEFVAWFGILDAVGCLSTPILLSLMHDVLDVVSIKKASSVSFNKFGSEAVSRSYKI